LKDRTDLVALLDEFASRFYDELDYVTECQNGIMMHADMASIEQVVVPLPFPEYCSRKVHVAQWIDGEKLSQSTASDVQDLVNVGVVAYLTQLLETGRFHAGT
jgi:aarF domain-containing kinase